MKKSFFIVLLLSLQILSGCSDSSASDQNKNPDNSPAEEQSTNEDSTEKSEANLRTKRISDELQRRPSRFDIAVQKAAKLGFEISEIPFESLRFNDPKIETIKNDKTLIYESGKYAFMPVFYHDDKDIYVIIREGIQKLEADIDTFKNLDYSFAIDKNYLYVTIPTGKGAHSYLHKVKLEDTSEFKILKDGYGIYGDYIFSDSYPWIFKADVNTYEVLNYAYTKDKNYVYEHGEIAPQFDPSTFEVSQSNGDCQKDKNGLYFQGREIEHQSTRDECLEAFES
jgi:hypothetical protein